MGVLPEPPEGGYDVEWPPLDEPTQKEEVEVAQLIADALNTLSGGNPSRLASRAELRQVIDWEPQLGSEAPSTFSDAAMVASSTINQHATHTSPVLVNPHQETISLKSKPQRLSRNN